LIYHQFSNPTNASNWLIERILLGRHPSQTDLHHIFAAGIDEIVNLTVPDEGLELYKIPQNVKYIGLPIPDKKICSDVDLVQLVDELVKDHNDGHSIYIHCKGGLGRTGVVAGLLLKKINYLDDFHQIMWFMNHQLQFREFKMVPDRMAYFKQPQTRPQIAQLRRLIEL